MNNASLKGAKSSPFIDSATFNNLGCAYVLKQASENCKEPNKITGTADGASAGASGSNNLI